MRSKHCITLWLSFGSYAAALIIPAPRQPVRTRRHAAPPLEFVKAVGAHLPLPKTRRALRSQRPGRAHPARLHQEGGLRRVTKRAAPVLEKSPVEYAGWTEDAAELLRRGRRARRPGSLLPPCLFRWYLDVDDRIQLAETGLGVYAVNLGLAAVAIFGFLDSARRSSSARTSRRGAAVEPAKGEVACYAAPGIIAINNPRELRGPYPHKYDPTTRGALRRESRGDAEDVARGGQTLATLLVCLNDVADGGCTPATSDITRTQKGRRVPLLPGGRVGAVRRAADTRGELPAPKWMGRIWVHAAIIGETGPPRRSSWRQVIAADS